MSDSTLLTVPRLEGTVTLDDGRRLGFAEFGAAHGRAVMWLHGTPGARRQIPEAARVVAAARGLRLVGVDRPGVGLSTPHLYHQIVDSAHDLNELADRLGIEDFGIIGLSGGGPYVLAAAHEMPERVRAAVVLGGVAPAVGPEAASGGIVALAAKLHPLLSAIRDPLSLGVAAFVWVARPVANPALSLYARLSPAHDRHMLGRPEFRAMFLDDLLNGSKPGLRAPIYDIVLFGQDWGFAVRDVQVPIEWWHGDADHIIPLRQGEHMVSLLPNARLHIRPGESHLGGLGDAEVILDSLIDAWDARDAQPRRAGRKRPLASRQPPSSSGSTSR
jgi:pimeloyl-ACP methyl ester carboxylesterase